MNPSTLFLLVLSVIILSLISITTASLADISYNRVAYVDLDPLVDDSDAAQEETNFDNAVAHIVAQGANTVYIQAYRDNEGYTRVSKMYFPNRALGEWNPGRNSFVKLANKLAAKNIAVGAWMPIIAYQISTIHNKPAEYILNLMDDGSTQRQDCTDASFYCSLTPFNHDNFLWVLSIYQDLLKAYPNLYIINGHDDAAMSQTQDMSQSALTAAGAAGLPTTASALAKLPWDGEDMKKWALLKSNKLSEFFGNLIKELRKIKPSLKSSRNFYVNTFLKANENSVRWFAQDCASALQHTDYLAPMVFPYMEKITPDGTGDSKFNNYFTNVMSALEKCTTDMNRFQICLQAVDWPKDKAESNVPVSAGEFNGWIGHVYSLGGVHIGYYPSLHYSDATSPITTGGGLYTKMTAPTTCTKNDDCTIDQVCNNEQKCVLNTSKPSCLKNSDCTVANTYCDVEITNTCLPYCTKSEDCNASYSQTCVQQDPLVEDNNTKVCKIQEDWGLCGDSVCNANQYCSIYNECVEHNAADCTSDDGCDEGLICQGGFCIASAMMINVASVLAFVLCVSFFF